MPRFRKKPVVIEAVEFTRANFNAGLIPLKVAVATAGPNCPGHQIGDLLFGAIKTLEGEMTAAPGDWIIKGVKGEIYPCKPDIFWATYEPEEEDASNS